MAKTDVDIDGETAAIIEQVDNLIAENSGLPFAPLGPTGRAAFAARIRRTRWFKRWLRDNGDDLAKASPDTDWMLCDEYLTDSVYRYLKHGKPLPQP